MAEVIDLRNQKKRSGTAAYAATETRQRRNADETPETIEWSALEHERREYSPQWFVAIGAAAVIPVIIGILARSYFFVTLIVLAFFVLVLYTRREPRMIEFSITTDGVRAGKTFYEFSQLKSFWIFNNAGAKELSLETGKVLSPFVRFPLGETDPEVIETVLTQHLAKKEHEDSVSDQIARGIGF